MGHFLTAVGDWIRGPLFRYHRVPCGPFCSISDL